MTLRLIIIYLSILSSISLIAQSSKDSFYHTIETGASFQVINTSEEIRLDGVLDESFWVKCDTINNFSQTFPVDNKLANGDTEIMMAYTDSHLYVTAICYSKSNDFVVHNLRRDYSFGNNDNITFLFDTYNDQTNALVFGMNPLGVRREATVIRGGIKGNDFDDSWDTKWQGASKIYDDYWICEMSIPFRSLRYDNKSKKWRFNCYRNDTQNNEFTGWVNIPRNKILMDLSCMGDMCWIGEIPKAGRNLSVIPYTSFNLSRDFEDPGQDRSKLNLDAGADIKYSLSSSLNLDLTFNPDFSQVEVDRQVTNLDRFEIFFPERRQFFLENADLFSSFGSSRARPFFSRRIGIAYDTLNELNVENTILYGARLSGKINENTRIGLLNMQTLSDLEIDLPGYNYTVAAVEKTIFGQSNIAAIAVNKQGLNLEEFGDTNNSYNRLIGLEYRLQSKDNIWTGKATYHRLFSPEAVDHKFASQILLIRNTKRWRMEYFQDVVGEGYNAEVGFVRRRDIFFSKPEIAFRIFPNKVNIAQHTLSASYSAAYKIGKEEDAIISTFTLVDWDLKVKWETSFKNSARLEFEFGHKHVTLLDDFDPTRIQEDDIFLPAGNKYDFSELSMSFRSDSRKVFSYNLNPVIGSFFSGHRAGISGRFSYRFPPKINFSIDYNYNYIDLKGAFEKSHLWLIGPRVDITFSKSVFFSNFFQYNNQEDNLNINSRFQWRFAPVSDLFIVYTDNYITDPFDQFSSRNRALVLKLSYWLNI